MLQRKWMIRRQHYQETFKHHAANKLADFIATETLVQRATGHQKIAEIQQTQHALIGNIVPQKNAGAFYHVVIRLAFSKPGTSSNRVGNLQMKELNQKNQQKPQMRIMKERRGWTHQIDFLLAARALSRCCTLDELPSF